ncbi:MAG TPA: CinA family protein [Parafilimonas sp.]|nr:CinA family protein [Parafilimonas sp.]
MKIITKLTAVNKTMVLNKNLIDSIGEELLKRNESIAVAESVTGGLLQVAFSIAENASQFFQGGITAYNVGQKYRHLLIDPLHALACDSVSVKIAQNMSKQVCCMFTSTFGLASTGYASLVPEKNIHELFTYYAIAKESRVIDSGIIYSREGEGLETQLFYVDQVLNKLKLILKKTS